MDSSVLVCVTSFLFVSEELLGLLLCPGTWKWSHHMTRTFCQTLLEKIVELPYVFMAYAFENHINEARITT